MLIKLPMIWIILLNTLGWPVIQLSLASLFTHLPTKWFTAPPAAAWERDGKFYERWCAIKHWKDLLPDGARWFHGGFAKKSLTQLDPAYLTRFIRETRRGECCHCLALAFTPLFFLWNPWWADAIILTYATTANLPCILAQRYNRIRLTRLLAARTARQAHRGKQLPNP